MATGQPFRFRTSLAPVTFNPLTPMQMAELEREYGRWAARRTIAMLSPTETFETARAIARSMYESMKARALAGLPPAPPSPPTRTTRVRRTKEKMPTVAELEAALGPKELTPELESDLTSRVLTTIRSTKRPLTVEFQQTLAKSVIAWAGEEGVKLSEDDAVRIVKSAIATLRPEVAVRTKEGEIIRWETSEGIPLPPEMWPSRT